MDKLDVKMVLKTLLWEIISANGKVKSFEGDFDDGSKAYLYTENVVIKF